MIINSILDNDLYKFTMMQAVLHQFPGAMVEYSFKCRTPKVDFRAYAPDIIREINQMCQNVVASQEDLDYLGSLRFIKKDFIEFLRIFRFNYDFLFIKTDDAGGLHIRINGPWLHTILFEVPILAIVSEVYSRGQNQNFDYFRQRTLEKAESIKLLKDDGFKFADFGTRRRHSLEAQRTALDVFKHWCPDNLVGTSNVMLAKEFGITPIGTMAHEWLQAHQALGYRISDSQKAAFENWAKEYRGDLGIALSDVIGLDAFLLDFDMYFAKLFDGVRQDSGDPDTFAMKMIQHYEKMRIDPRTKTIVFSDGLDFKKAVELWQRYRDKIRISFGIGTYLTNDFGFKPLQIVLKMVECNDQPVAKLSDSPEKGMCNDKGYVEYITKVFSEKIRRAEEE